MKPTSKAAGRAAQEFKHAHHAIIIKAMHLLKEQYPKQRHGWTVYGIQAATKYLAGYSKGMEVAAVFRRMSELVALGVIEVTEHLGTTPSGRRCSCYRLKNKKK